MTDPPRMTYPDVARIVGTLRGKPLHQCVAGLRAIAAGRAWAYPDHRADRLDSDEHRLLAALLWCPVQILDVRAELPAEAFVDEVARSLFEAMLFEFDETGTLDYLTLAANFGKMPAAALVLRLHEHLDCDGDDAIRYARRIAAAWGDRP